MKKCCKHIQYAKSPVTSAWARDNFLDCLDAPGLSFLFLKAFLSSCVVGLAQPWFLAQNKLRQLVRGKRLYFCLPGPSPHSNFPPCKQASSTPSPYSHLPPCVQTLSTRRPNYRDSSSHRGHLITHKQMPTTGSSSLTGREGRHRPIPRHPCHHCKTRRALGPQPFSIFELFLVGGWLLFWVALYLEQYGTITQKNTFSQDSRKQTE